MTRHSALHSGWSLSRQGAICGRPTSARKWGIGREGICSNDDSERLSDNRPVSIAGQIAEEVTDAAAAPTPLNVSAILEGETMRFKWLDSKTLILKSRKELVTSLVAAAVVTAAGCRHRFGLSSFGPGPLATAQRCGSRVPERERRRHDENDE